MSELSRSEIQYIISKVLDNIRKAQEKKDVLAVFARYTPFFDKSVEIIKNRDPFALFCALNNVYAERSDIRQISETDFINSCLDIRRIYVAGAGLSFLKRVVSGDDDRTLERAVIQSLLQGQEVICITDFEFPRLRVKGEAFFKNVSEIYRDVEAAGIKILPANTRASLEGVDFVSEEYVVQAAKNKVATIYCAPRALVTPSARDKASEYNIEIIESER